MIKVWYMYKSKKTNKWSECEFITDSVVKALRFIHKIKSTNGYLFQGFGCIDSEDTRYLSSRI